VLHLRATLSGVPVCQLGLPIDFLADSELHRFARGYRGGGADPGPAGELREGAPAQAKPHAPTTGVTIIISSNLLVSARRHGHEGGDAMSGAGRVENRCYTRYTLNAPATIWRNSASLGGYIVNVSLGGAFIRMYPALPMHEAVTVSMHDPAKQAGLLNDLPATVIRTTETGCAVRFDRMLLERGIGDALNGHQSGNW
jgi:hypothetical protein